MARWRLPAMATAPIAPFCLGFQGRRRKGSIRLRSKRSILDSHRGNIGIARPPHYSFRQSRSTCSFIAIKCIPLPALLRTPMACVSRHSTTTVLCLWSGFSFPLVAASLFPPPSLLPRKVPRPDWIAKRGASPTLSIARKNFWRERRPPNITISQLMWATSVRWPGVARLRPRSKTCVAAFCTSGE